MEVLPRNVVGPNYIQVNSIINPDQLKNVNLPNLPHPIFFGAQFAGTQFADKSVRGPNENINHLQIGIALDFVRYLILLGKVYMKLTTTLFSVRWLYLEMIWILMYQVYNTVATDEEKMRVLLYSQKSLRRIRPLLWSLSTTLRHPVSLEAQ